MRAEVDRVFHYAVPDELKPVLTPGHRVAVPFGGRNVEGCVVGFSKPSVDPSRIKAITAVLDDYPLLTPVMLELARWMKTKYYTTLAACLRCVAPSWTGSAKRAKTLFVCINGGAGFAEELSHVNEKGGPQALVMKLLSERGATALAPLLKELGISASPVHTLVKKGLVILEERSSAGVSRSDIAYEPGRSFSLTDEQAEAIETLLNTQSEKPGRMWLLHGVTGSGKTEIYMRLIEKALEAGKQAVMLVPEISLTPQAVDAFKQRFGAVVSVTHSRLTPAERVAEWQAAREGRVSVMIGPRSAVFTPFNNLGTIIIDEEHEKTYVSETSPKYAVIDVAEKLSKLTGAAVVLGSATPSVETFYRAKCEEIGLITLKKRVNNRFPDVETADLRTELAAGNRSIFSRRLLDAMDENLKRGHQTILFMNRRGHSTFVSCRTCGFVLECGHCSVNYTYHIQSQRMLCHYCGAAERPPSLCPVCESVHIRYFGVGTQKIEEEVRRLFPGCSVLRMDMDTTARKDGHESIIRRFATGQAQILVGTQMIAKGLNFPNVSLVGIVDADTALNTGDFRSAETAFQLITQVSGRAGRADVPGRVIIQTYNPEHYSVSFAKEGDYNSFYEHEIRVRKTLGYPPFGDIFMALMSCPDEKRLINTQNELARLMKAYNRKGFFEILGPAPAMVSKINNMYRWKILIKSSAVGEDILLHFAFYCVDKLKNRCDLDGVNLNLTLNPRILV